MRVTNRSLLLLVAASSLRCQSSAFTATNKPIQKSFFLPVEKDVEQNTFQLMKNNLLLPPTSLHAVGTQDRERSRHTEVDRARFQLNQMKEEVLVAELRATAAERRVAMLKLKADEKSGKAKFEKESKALNEKIKTYEGTLQNLEVEKKKAINKLKNKSKKEKKKLYEEIKLLEDSRDEAKLDANRYKNETSELTKSLGEIKLALDTANEDLRNERENLKMLKQKMEIVRLSLTNEISDEKENARLEKKHLLEKMEKEISVRDEAIGEYKEERASVRKMAKQSLRLMKTRVVNLVKRIKQ